MQRKPLVWLPKIIIAKKLQDATGKTGKGYEAHHTLPQKYEEKFNEAGINIHEPGNTVWRETDNHRGKSHQHIKE